MSLYEIEAKFIAAQLYETQCTPIDCRKVFDIYLLDVIKTLARKPADELPEYLPELVKTATNLLGKITDSDAQAHYIQLDLIDLQKRFDAN